MPTLAATLKHEIRRLARREVRAETGKTKEAVARYRLEIARLKRQMQAAEKKMAFFETQERKRLEKPASAEQPLEGTRFSARSVAAQRKRLKLSAEQFAKLVGVSSLTIYNWEHGRNRPRQQQFAALVAARRLGRREALAKLDLLKAKASRAVKKGRGRKKGK